MDDINEDPKAPQGLIDALRALHAGAPSVPHEIDDGILSAARRRMAALRRRPRLLRWVAAGAVAAAVLVAFFVSRLNDDAEGSPVAGRVTILDAFALARRIEAGSALPADDVNHDGRIDGADVDHLAMAAVALPPRAGGGR